MDMRMLSGMYVNVRERLVRSARREVEGQTMTEYALILAAVAIVAYVTYQVIGQDIGSMVNKVDSALSGA
jgi:Flp pilus assembly pilin Flp